MTSTDPMIVKGLAPRFDDPGRDAAVSGASGPRTELNPWALPPALPPGL